jgi:hypothetical protein
VAFTAGEFTQIATRKQAKIRGIACLHSRLHASRIGKEGRSLIFDKLRRFGLGARALAWANKPPRFRDFFTGISRLRGSFCVEGVFRAQEFFPGNPSLRRMV